MQLSWNHPLPLPTALQDGAPPRPHQPGAAHPGRPTAAAQGDTPVFHVDLDVVADRLRVLREVLPEVSVLYAVKANPAAEIITMLAELDAEFDVASPGEIDACLRLGIGPKRLSYGNTIKKERDSATAVAAGVRRFTVDCAAELAKVLRTTSEGCVFVRLATDGSGADWPLSKKFGCHPPRPLL